MVKGKNSNKFFPHIIIASHIKLLSSNRQADINATIEIKKLALKN